MSSSQPIWSRAWRYKNRRKKQRVHIEVRDTDQTFGFVRAYRGKDHTFHVILEEGFKKPKKAAHARRKVKPKVQTVKVVDPDSINAALYKVREGLRNGSHIIRIDGDEAGEYIRVSHVLDLLDSAAPPVQQEAQ